MLTKDSGFNLVRSTILALNEIEDWHYYVLIPPECMEEVKPMFPKNVTLVPYPYMNDALNSRFHFDTNALNSYFNNYKHDIDVCWTMLPEHSGALKAFFNKRREEIPVFSLIAWMDYKPTKGYEPSYLLRMVDGILSSDAVAIQSDHMLKFMAHDLLWKYRDIVNTSDGTYVINPKTEVPDVESRIGDIIGFPHRISTESYFKEMFELCKDKLRYVLWVTNLNNNPIEPHPMLLVKPVENHDDYYKQLANIRFGISYHIGYSMWSMSVLDMMAVGKVVLVPKRNAFPEMFPEDYPFFFSDEDEFLRKLYYLQTCDNSVLIEWGCRNREIVQQRFTWDIQAREISKIFYGMLRPTKSNKKTASVLREITKYKILTKGDAINKNLTDFSRQCSRAWNRVRIELMRNHGIKDDMSTEYTTFYLPDYDLSKGILERPVKRPTNYDLRRKANGST
jgi:hypothetical protein